jgi:small subunit ribosomal protein S1
LAEHPQETASGGVEVETMPGGPEMDTMESLLAEESEYKSLRRGDVVEGTLMSWDRDGALVDIGSKSEGVVHRNEMHSLGPDPDSKVQPGDTVLVYVIQPETHEGQVLLSFDRARGEQGWRVLQERFESGETFEAMVSGYNRGGLLVNVEGVNAFVPLSQVVGVRPDRGRENGGLAEAVGKPLRLKVIEINRRRNRVILSERAALQEWRMQQKERLIEELQEGDVRRGTVSSVRSFGVFVDLGGADGLAHLSELSWERDRNPEELYKVGDEVDVYVMKVDHERKKIALSLRRANPSQWEDIVSKFQEDQVVVGLITKLVSFGAFARIEGPIEGLVHVSELVDRRINHPREVVREGDLVPLKIVRIERDRHRLGLSLRRARNEAENMGFVFTDGGEVLTVPEHIREEYIAREGPIPDFSDVQTDEETAAPAEAEASNVEAEVEAPEVEADTNVESTADVIATEAPEAAVEEAIEEASEAAESESVAEAEAVAETMAADEPAPETEATVEAEAADAAEPVAEAEEPAEATAPVEAEEPSDEGTAIMAEAETVSEPAPEEEEAPAQP